MKQFFVTIMVIGIVLGTPWIVLSYPNGNVLNYLSSEMPPGQRLYLIAKAFGIYGLLILSIQAVLGIAGRPALSRLGLRDPEKMHVVVGLLLTIVIFTHIGLYLVASAARGADVLSKFIPIFSDDHYTSAVSFGALALWAIVIAITLALLKDRFPWWWRRGHWLAPASLMLVVVHASLIGSDLTSWTIISYLMLLFGGFVGALVLRRRSKSINFV